MLENNQVQARSSKNTLRHEESKSWRLLGFILKAEEAHFAKHEAQTRSK